MRQKLIALQGKTEESTASLEKSPLLFAEVPRSSQQKISRDVTELNSTINQLDVIDICGAVRPTRTETHSLAHMGRGSHFGL